MPSHDVSIEVAAHEVLGIIGPNGAGKTTLFDLISGYLRVRRRRGAARRAQRDSMGPAGRAERGLGRSFQDAALFSSMTVEQTIAVACERWVKVRDPFSAALHLPNAYDSERQSTARVGELVDLLGLDASTERSSPASCRPAPSAIVGLACLLAHRPSVILLDEPSSGIAQKRGRGARARCCCASATRPGASLVVIEHDMPLLRSVSDRMVAMDQGAVIATG